MDDQIATLANTLQSSRSKRDNAAPEQQRDEQETQVLAPQQAALQDEEPQRTSAQARAPVAVGRSLEAMASPDVVMELLVDKLKLLDYERDFCKRKKPHRKPLTRLYFAVPDSLGNQGQQFHTFASLATWLLSLAGLEIPTPKEFDDPQMLCTNILNGCKKLGFASPAYHPTKLTVGHGKEVCGVLDGLVDYILERRNFSYKKPVRPTEGLDNDADIDDAPDQNAEIAIEFPRPQYLDEEVEEAYMQHDTPGGMASELAGLGPGPAIAGGSGAGKRGSSQVPGGGGQGPAAEDRQVLHSKVDPTQWRMEVERVGPRLKILLNADAKDWRSHLEEVTQHSKTISAAWPDSRTVLDKLRTELDASLDKLSTRERFLNDQFDRLMQQYRASRTQLTAIQGTCNNRSEAVSSLNSELARITEQLSEMKGIMDEHSTNISDATPVVRMKNAIKKLSEELHETEVRIGVVSHTLLQLSVKNKQALQAEAAALSEEESA